MPAHRVGLLALLPFLFVPVAELPAQNPALRRLVERGRHPAIRWGRFPDVQREAATLYVRNQWEPLWLDRNRPTRAARALADLLATGADRGLDPDDYDARQLAAFIATLDRQGADAEQAIRFDVALTIASLRFSRALARGRIPRQGASLDFDGVPVLDAIRITANADSIISGLEPGWPGYRDLKRTLGRYRRFVRDSAQRRTFYLGRIRQLELALERWRWLPGQPLVPSLVVSSPAGSVQLTEGDGTTLFIRGSVQARCSSLTVFSGVLWMLTIRPVEQAGVTIRFRIGDGLDLLARGPKGSGCLTMRDGELLAERLLRGRIDWPAERVRMAMAGGRQLFVRLARPVQVQYVYGTAYPGENGQVLFTADAFRLDRGLEAALRRGYPY